MDDLKAQGYDGGIGVEMVTPPDATALPPSTPCARVCACATPCARLEDEHANTVMLVIAG